MVNKIDKHYKKNNSQHTYSSCKPIKAGVAWLVVLVTEMASFIDLRSKYPKTE